MLFFSGKLFQRTLLIIILAEFFSLFGYLLPSINKIAFLVIVILALALSLYKLEYGLWILLAELFIGSKGYLFFFDFNGAAISIRIALWLIIMSVWAGKTIINFIKNRDNKEIKLPSYFFYFLVLFIFIAWGIVNGFLNNNEFSNIFFDFNGWLYFALIFPIYSAIKEKQNIHSVLQIFIAAISWLSFKTFILLFIFSHYIPGASELYRWVRISGVGEITQMQGGFYRIFFQSHIFILIGFLIFLLLFANTFINNKITQHKSFLISYFFFLFSLLSVILISFSRSFWAGLAVGVFLVFAYLIWQNRRVQWKKIFQLISILIISGIISVGLIMAIVKFPYPRPVGGFATAELLAKRVSELKGESAVSSRWTLLPEMWNKIKKAPILGHGFGTTITYKSSDPRALETSATGEYTTYAFEWGWLDIWLKLGLFGMLAYLWLIVKICLLGLKSASQSSRPCTRPGWSDREVALGLTIGLLLLTVVSIFSPYLNHPLGIGYLILVSAIFSHNA